MKKLITLYTLALLVTLHVKGQNGVSNIWMTGYASGFGFPYGNTTIDFYSGTPSIGLDSNPMNFMHTASTIADSNGNLLFYTNGNYIADVTKDTMLNGSGLNPSAYTSSQLPYGLAIPQANLILPYPDSANLYSLFHSTIDNPPLNNNAYFLYNSIVDMNLNGGLGAVLLKNSVKINDTLNAGKITACKHGNGRDWWIICLKANSNIIYKLLLTPTGVQGPFYQSIGIYRTWSKGQIKFSQDGTKFAHVNAEALTVGNLEIFDFDRCTGVFSNPIHIVLPQAIAWGGGVEFSPNSNLLYVSNIDTVYQYDLNSANIAGSQVIIAVWDSFYSPNPPFAAFLEYMELAPDGRIYVTTGNSTLVMHVINNPNSIGITCSFAQHSLQMPAYYINTLPNHPNYFLGRLIGSSCDTVWQGLTPSPSTLESGIKVLSNPNDGRFTLWFAVHDKPGCVEVFDVNGNIVYKEGVAQWSQYKQVDIQKEPNGIYFCRMSWQNGFSSVKIIKQ